MSFVTEGDQFYEITEDGTYTSEDGTESVALYAGDKISIQQAARLGLAELPKTEYADPSLMPDTAENKEAIHGAQPQARSKGAAPENRVKAAPAEKQGS